MESIPMQTQVQYVVSHVDHTQVTIGNIDFPCAQHANDVNYVNSINNLPQAQGHQIEAYK